MEQNKWHAYDVWRHGMECMDACVGDPVLRIAALLHDVGKPRDARVVGQDARTTRSTTTSASAPRSPSPSPSASASRTTSARASSPSCATTSFTTRPSGPTRPCAAGSAAWAPTASRISTPSTRPTCARRGATSRPDLAALAALKAHVARVLAEGAALSTRDLKVSGHDLMKELGLAPGPVIGKILDALLEAVLSDPARERARRPARPRSRVRVSFARVTRRVALLAVLAVALLAVRRRRAAQVAPAGARRRSPVGRLAARAGGRGARARRVPLRPRRARQGRVLERARLGIDAGEGAGRGPRRAAGRARCSTSAVRRTPSGGPRRWRRRARTRRGSTRTRARRTRPTCA